MNPPGPPMSTKQGVSDAKHVPALHVCGTPDAMCDTDCMRKASEWPMCEADCDRMERAAIAIEALTSQRDAFFAALNEALEYFEDCEDVIDGAYGEPAPNKEMLLAQSIRAALKSAKGQS